MLPHWATWHNKSIANCALNQSTLLSLSSAHSIIQPFQCIIDKFYYIDNYNVQIILTCYTRKCICSLKSS